MAEEVTQTTETEEVDLTQFNEVDNKEPGKAPEAGSEPEKKPEDGKEPEKKPETDTDKAKEPEKKTETEADIYAELDTIKAEGVTIDKDTLKSFKDIAKANNLSADAAKAIVNLQVQAAKKQADDFKALQKSWEDASKVVYGDNLKNVETNCSRVLAELDKDGKFKELLALAGAEKHPATLGFLKTIGDKLLEKPMVNPNATVSTDDEVELEDFN